MHVDNKYYSSHKKQTTKSYSPSLYPYCINHFYSAKGASIGEGVSKNFSHSVVSGIISGEKLSQQDIEI